MYYVLLVFGLYFQVCYMRAKITLFSGFSGSCLMILGSS